MITFVWAEDENHGIGYQGQLPWHLPADMKHFKEKTINHPILMGRKTFNSFPHLLPKRKHLVLTHDQNFKEKYLNNPQVKVFLTTEELQDYLREHVDEDIKAIGGVSIFNLLKEQVDVLEKTEIHHRFKVDTYMPNLNYGDFRLVKKESHPADDKNKYAYDFLTFKRNS